MKFRLTAFSVHLLGSACAMLLILGGLYLGWYRWPGWYLTDVLRVVLIMMAVDLVLGPLLTFIVANSSKPRSELTRDIGIIVCVQLVALVYGTYSLWNGRPLYYAFSETVLQQVQAYDIEPADAAQGRGQNPALAPQWYSLPRWIWAPLPNGKEGEDIMSAAVGGGKDVIALPRYYKAWTDGLETLRTRLQTVEKVKYFDDRQKAVLKVRMQAAGFDPARANAMTLTGRGKWLLAVFDEKSVEIAALLRAD
jgi:hypothetical protein